MGVAPTEGGTHWGILGGTPMLGTVMGGLGGAPKWGAPKWGALKGQYWGGTCMGAPVWGGDWEAPMERAQMGGGGQQFRGGHKEAQG